MAVVLIGPNERLDSARSCIEAGATLPGSDPQIAELQGEFIELRVRAQLASGSPDSALRSAEQAVAVTRDDHSSRDTNGETPERSASYSPASSTRTREPWSTRILYTPAVPKA